ncbi:hypothetical protein NDU88_006554 [Pleurodeles waltl]|uniref:Uncharacterized protein n=1 Tax=Pleurodeles waltl TaxID=8319 RepID=A0AAV7MD72_PLEWA|nr:hypothetical protein NDU88_006554 [Pleurodeles waltl]
MHRELANIEEPQKWRRGGPHHALIGKALSGGGVTSSEAGAARSIKKERRQRTTSRALQRHGKKIIYNEKRAAIRFHNQPTVTSRRGRAQTGRLTVALPSSSDTEKDGREGKRIPDSTRPLPQAGTEMPGGKSRHKSTGKPVRQLLFSEALQHKHPTSPPVGPHMASTLTQPSMMTDKDQPTTMERILQEITAVSRQIEGMDTSISSLTLETKSIRSDIASFQSQVTGLDHRMGTLETQMATIQGRDQDLLYLQSKITDLEDRSRRDNIRLFGIPENKEGSDVQAFLSSALPKLTSLTFDPPLEFQRAHRVDSKHPDGATRPRPIIACLLRHIQTRQLLQVARNHGPFRMDIYEVHITADYSKDTKECRKSFLALRPRLHQLEMKYGLFDPARMRGHQKQGIQGLLQPRGPETFSGLLPTPTKGLLHSDPTTRQPGRLWLYPSRRTREGRRGTV